MYTLLTRKCEGMSEDMIAFARRLVETPSPSLEEGRVAQIVVDRMRALGYHDVIQDDYGNVVGTMPGRKSEPAVLLISHMDTVAVDRSSDEGRPTDGTLRGGRLYGPGAADCKGGLAAQVYAGALLKRSLLPLKGNLIVAATVAEQNGLSVGMRALLEHTLPEMEIKPTYAILGEPTDLNLYYGHDGWMEFDIDVEGANPFHVEDVARSIFAELDSRVDGRDNRRPQALTVYAPRFETEKGIRRSTIRTAQRLGQSEEYAEVLNRVKHEVQAVAHNSGDVAVNVIVRTENQQLYNGRTCVVRQLTNAWSIDPFHPLMTRARQILSAAACKVQPGKWQLGRLGMGTAGSVLVRDFNVPTIGYGPGEESLAHTPGEYVETENLEKALYGTAALVHGLIGIPVYGWTSDEI